MSKAVKNLSKSAPAAPQKPAAKAPEKPKETAQEIIARAQKQIRDTAQQIEACKVFCFHVDEGNGAYDFSLALWDVLNLIGQHAGDAAETLNAAAAQLQKGGAQ